MCEVYVRLIIVTIPLGILILKVTAKLIEIVTKLLNRDIINIIEFNLYKASNKFC